jgi:hypothetical protein
MPRVERKSGTWTSIIALLVATGCGDKNSFLMNNEGVPVALDLPSCEILALNEFEPSDESRDAYRLAVARGQIVHLLNHVFVKPDGSVALNFENKHLVPWKPPGPATLAEELGHHIAVYQWVVPTEGHYQGRKVCVSSSMRYGSYAMP